MGGKHKFFINYFMCMNVLPSCDTNALHVCMVLPEVRKGVRFLGTGMTDTYKPLCGHCELNLSPLEGQQVLFTLNSEPRLALISLTPISWA